MRSQRLVQADDRISPLIRNLWLYVAGEYLGRRHSHRGSPLVDATNPTPLRAGLPRLFWRHALEMLWPRCSPQSLRSHTLNQTRIWLRCIPDLARLVAGDDEVLTSVSYAAPVQFVQIVRKHWEVTAHPLPVVEQ